MLSPYLSLLPDLIKNMIPRTIAATLLHKKKAKTIIEPYHLTKPMPAAVLLQNSCK
jgi:hypothetical protein